MKSQTIVGGTLEDSITDDEFLCTLRDRTPISLPARRIPAGEIPTSSARDSRASHETRRPDLDLDWYYFIGVESTALAPTASSTTTMTTLGKPGRKPMTPKMSDSPSALSPIESARFPAALPNQ